MYETNVDIEKIKHRLRLSWLTKNRKVLNYNLNNIGTKYIKPMFGSDKINCEERELKLLILSMNLGGLTEEIVDAGITYRVNLVFNHLGLGIYSVNYETEK